MLTFASAAEYVVSTGQESASLWTPPPWGSLALSGIVQCPLINKCKRSAYAALPSRLRLAPTSRINFYSYDKIEKKFFF